MKIFFGGRLSAIEPGELAQVEGVRGRRDTPSLAPARPAAYPTVMTDNPNKPLSPWQLNSGRVVLLILGALILVYVVSTMLGGLGNYQHLKEAAQGDSAQPATTAAP